MKRPYHRILAICLGLGLLLPLGEELAMQFGLVDSDLSSLVVPLETEEKKETEKEEKKKLGSDEFDLNELNSNFLRCGSGSWLEQSIYHQSWVNEIPSPPPDYTA